MALTKAKKIELLQRQIDAAKDGDPDDFAEWKTTTETVLRHTVGEGSAALSSFRGNSYNLPLWSTGTPQSEFDNARRGESAWRSGISSRLLRRSRCRTTRHPSPRLP